MFLHTQSVRFQGDRHSIFTWAFRPSVKTLGFRTRLKLCWTPTTKLNPRGTRESFPIITIKPGGYDSETWKRPRCGVHGRITTSSFFLGACWIIPPPLLDRIPGMWKQDSPILYQDPLRSSEIESFVISCTRDPESSTFRGSVPFV